MMTTPSIEVLITFISIQLNKMIGFHTDTTDTYAPYFVSTNYLLRKRFSAPPEYLSQIKQNEIQRITPQGFSTSDYRPITAEKQLFE